MNSFHQHFVRPEALFLLALVPVLAILSALDRRRRRKALIRLGTMPPLESFFSLRTFRRMLHGFCLNTGLTFLIMGIAGPQWGRDWGQSASTGRDLVVVLDVSRSMYAEDVLPNRLTRARQALADLVESMADTGRRDRPWAWLRGTRLRTGDRLALVIFAARPRILCPLTHDYNHVLAALDRLSVKQPPPDLLPREPGESGTRIGMALQEAVRLHEEGFRGSQDILLISDGDDPGDDAALDRQRGVDAARRERIVIHTIGIGNPEADTKLPFEYEKEVTTRLRERPLRDMARATGGQYIPAQQKALPLGQIFREHSDDALPVYKQRYEWFFGLGLAFLAVDMTIGRRRRRGGDGPPGALEPVA